MKKRYVLKNKARFVFFITFILVSLWILFSINNTYGYNNSSFITITVKSGDTLWDIAEEYNSGRDIRYYIHSLKKLNNLKNSDIKEGMELKVITE